MRVLFTKPIIWSLAASALIHLAVLGLPFGTGTAPSSSNPIDSLPPLTVQMRPTNISSDQNTQIPSGYVKPMMESDVPRLRQLAADPKNGKIYADYFFEVKQRLNNAVSEIGGFSGASSEIIIEFVLDRNGWVAGYHVAGTLAQKQYFEKLIAEAQPFKPFPSIIPHNHIAFELKVEFGKSVSNTNTD